MDNREIILDVKKLNTTFVSDRKKVRIVKDVSFQVKRGKTLAVVRLRQERDHELHHAVSGQKRHCGR